MSAAGSAVREVEVLVVGAGPSGLAAAYALQGDTLVVEKRRRVGGLCRSIGRGGGVFDIGGHSFHTPHPEVADLVTRLMDGGLYTQRRDARIYSHGALIPYPFQKFYDRLPNPDVVRACEAGLRAANGAPSPPRNFEEYLVGKFGAGIAEHFMLPYNRKLWARDIAHLSCEWTSERIAGTKNEAERFDTTGGQRKPLQADTEVGYPATGGFERIYRSFVPHLPAVELGRDIVHIDPRRRMAHAADGRPYRWRCLVSTMPLPLLVEVVEGTPPEVREAAKRLEYMSLRVELLLTSRPLETQVQRIYVAEKEIPPHKIALNHNSSESLRRRPRHAIMAEVSVSAEKRVEAAEIAPRTISLLCDLGVLRSPDDIAWTGHVNVKYAYPIYTHERPALLAAVREWMTARDIHPLGRFGDWEYVNSDRCVMKGLALGRELRERLGPPSRAVAAASVAT